MHMGMQCCHTWTHRGENEYSIEQVHQFPGHAGCELRPLSPKEVIAQWPTTKAAIEPCIVRETPAHTAQPPHD